MNKIAISLTICAGLIAVQSAAGANLASALFTYQGQLKLSGVPVTDNCDFEFTLWKHETDTAPAQLVGPTLTFDGAAGNASPILVSQGLFTAQLDFGANVFDGNPRWLEVAVSCPTGVGAYTVLTPRDPITMTPYAAQTRGIHVTENGDVGIGTTNPNALVHIDGSFGNLLQVGDNFGMFVTSQGDVGVGTNRPKAKLDVTTFTNGTILSVTGSGNPMVAVDGISTDALMSIKGSASRTLLSIDGKAKNLLHVRGEGFEHGNHIAFFDNVGATSPDGIAIRLGQSSTNRDNNFVTFLNGRDIVTGRIEGFDLENADWVIPPPMPTIGVTIDPAITYNPNWLNPGALPTATFTRGSLPSLTFTRGALPTATFTRGALPTLSVTGGALPSVIFSRGSLPSLTFNKGTIPSFSATTTRILGVNVVTGFSFSAGSTPSATFNDGSLPTLTFNRGSFPAISLNQGSLPSLRFTDGALPSAIFTRGTLPSLSFSGGSLPSILAPPITIGNPSIVFDLPTRLELDALFCWAIETGVDDYIQLDPVSLAVAALKQDVIKRCKDEGVTYGSKGADYAEWLPKLNPADQFQFGQIVGVHGGKVSLKTEGAEQIMAISRAPVVIGNVPSQEDEHNNVTVGFMGQLPVVVHGHVRAGDYIIPSGKEDGTAIAISPENFRLEHLGCTLGRAWSDSTNDVFSLVNVAIGLNGHEPNIILQKHQLRIESLTRQQTALAAENARLSAQLDDTHTKLTTMMTAIAHLEDQMQAQQGCFQPTGTTVSNY